MLPLSSPSLPVLPTVLKLCSTSAISHQPSVSHPLGSSLMETQKPSILIFNEKEIPSDGLTLLTFPHPKHTTGGGVLFCQAGKNFYELQSVQPRKYGSWFIDQRIASDGSYLMASKFDPKFILLPFLEKNARFSPLDQIVTYVEGCDRVPLQNCAEWQLDDICDINDQLGDDMILYRLNMEKTLEWLRSKVDRTAIYLCKKRVETLATQVSTFNSGAQSCQGKDQRVEPSGVGAEFVAQREDVVEALGVICDLLSDSLVDQLLQAYHVPKESIEKTAKTSTQKRKADWETALEVEKETLSYNSAVCATSSGGEGLAKKSVLPGSNSGGQMQKKMATSAKKQAAPVKGAGSIMSFLGKKSK